MEKHVDALCDVLCWNNAEKRRAVMKAECQQGVNICIIMLYTQQISVFGIDPDVSECSTDVYFEKHGSWTQFLQCLVILSTEGYVSLKCVLKYTSGMTPPFTEAALGQLRSKMVLHLLESCFGCVIKGET